MLTSSLVRRVAPSCRRLQGYRHLSRSCVRHDEHEKKLQALYKLFSDPSSPYYLAPGEAGPADPDDPPSLHALARAGLESHEKPTQSAHKQPEIGRERPVDHSAEHPQKSTDAAEKPLDRAQEAFDNWMAGREYARKEGYDVESMWEQQVAWGDLDSFRHLNNVRYVRFFESGRMRLTEQIGAEVGGPRMAKDMMEGRGVSIILKSIDVRFRRPVTYPDTLLIAHKPHSFTPTQFTLSCLAYSYTQQAPVCTAEAVCVWYDYDIWKKCVPPRELSDALQRRGEKS